LQWLNLGIFHAIGHAGVYYGFKLGHTIPWVDGFPFNVVSHPQYVGSVATLLGMAALVSGLAMVPNSARHREQRPHWQAGLWRGRRGSLRKPAKCTFAHPQSRSHSRRHPPRRPLQVWTQAPAGLGALAFYWTMLYVVTAFQESKLHID
jgi:protein-S-isoprenylcysteine O-methyltransferase Ste14